MKKLLTVNQMREADKFTIGCGIDSSILMRRAGYALADEVVKACRKGKNTQITVVCGIGNNGGDGYVCARKLLSLGYAVKVYAFEGKLSLDCAREKARYEGEYIKDICGDIIVDCIFGTGLTRSVEHPFTAVIESINESEAYVISADIPSGLNGDNGLACGIAVKADLTVAIAQLKVGYYLNDGLDLCGEIICKDIGIPSNEYIAELLEDGEISPVFPERKRNTHKGSYGSCSIYAGQAYQGSAILALNGATCSGCGYIYCVCDSALAAQNVSALPQVIYTEERVLNCQSIAFGMGMGVSEQVYSELKFLLENYTGKLIIDADGINCLSVYGKDILLNAKCKVLLTPHIREFARLCLRSEACIISDPVSAVRDFAKKYGVCVILKSASAVISDGENCAVCARGNSSLARGGSGDLLSGFIAGIAARGESLYSSALGSHYVMGSAAERASAVFTEYCVTWRDILDNIPEAINEL